ncbi:uncharacterized protein [Spinacia oleracea]|uniref:Retrotransposon Copia-like N-terminal domain-containing protein n=1 Tax=Spinacia oleracea TaxID=3562 RepID=A0ABM3R5G6_SPIOL|nr:uncharacterized protein LOC130466172 [Spinacia oleracea]
MADKLHPATTVTNIKTCIPILLDYEGSLYHNWSTLFKLHCRANLVLDHILPPKDTPTASSTITEADKLAAKALWERLDDIARQWIYGTVSNDLLNTIINQDDTVADAWNRLRQIFQDNKSARALALDAKFTTTRLADFPNVKAYCTRLKVLSDLLANVGQPVSDERLVLRTLRGLTDDFKTFRTTVQHRTPLPTFDKLRSMLDLEEDSHTDDIAVEPSLENALFVQNNNPDILVNGGQQPNNNANNRENNNRGRRNNRGRGGGGNRNNRGGNGGGGNHRGNNQPRPNQQQQQPITAQPWMFPPWAAWGPQPWATPACPHPTTGWQPRSATSSQQQQPGILGARPQQQSYFMATPSPYYVATSSNAHVPTDIEQAMHTMTIQQPDDQWYMDTGATSHMTSSQGFADGEQTNEM